MKLEWSACVDDPKIIWHSARVNNTRVVVSMEAVDAATKRLGRGPNQDELQWVFRWLGDWRPLPDAKTAEHAKLDAEQWLLDWFAAGL
jgi:hypothetical protein